MARNAKITMDAKLRSVDELLPLMPSTWVEAQNLSMSYDELAQLKALGKIDTMITKKSCIWGISTQTMYRLGTGQTFDKTRGG